MRSFAGILITIVVAFAVSGAMGDVSHLDLNRQYLPPTGGSAVASVQSARVTATEDVPAHLVDTASVVVNAPEIQQSAVPVLDLPKLYTAPVAAPAPVVEQTDEDDIPEPAFALEALPASARIAATPVSVPSLPSAPIPVPAPVPTTAALPAPGPSAEYIPPAIGARTSAPIAALEPAPAVETASTYAAPAPVFRPPVPAPIIEEVLSNGIDTQYGSNGGYVY